MTKILHLISGPRNISTALMYAFGNRSDCTIVDEPMYAVYLKKHRVQHPGRAEVLASLPTKMPDVKAQVFESHRGVDLLFVKNMAHHFIDVDHQFIYKHRNIFLIREPKQLISSFAQVIPNPNMQDIGLQKEFELFEDTQANAEFPPIVLDSNEILKDPKGVLSKLCKALDIPFSDRMLQWTAGPRAEDGVWAKYWYANVHQSTGFKKQQTKERELPVHLEALYQKSKSYYDILFQNSIKA